jgi:hypothetical protein
MKKIILSLSILLHSSFLFAEDILTAPYIGYTNYDDTEKEHGYNVGVYSKLKEEKHSFELLLDYNAINYKNDINSSDSNTTFSPSSTKNINIALLYNYDIDNSFKLYSALNYINSSDHKYNHLISLLAGLEKRINQFKFGTNVSFSKFNSSSVAKSAEQITPYFGFYFGDYNSLMGNFFTKISYDFISLHSVQNNMKSSYSPHSISFINFKNNFETKLEMWFGKSLYALRDKGLTKHYLADVYKDSIILSSKYKVSKEFSVQLSYMRRAYIAYNETSESTMKSYLISTYFKF